MVIVGSEKGCVIRRAVSVVALQNGECLLVHKVKVMDLPSGPCPVGGVALGDDAQRLEQDRQAPHPIPDRSGKQQRRGDLEGRACPDRR